MPTPRNLKKLIILFITAVIMSACNLPAVATDPSSPTPTQYVIYITETPIGYVAPTSEVAEGGLPVGPFQHTPLPTEDGLPVPTLDLSDLTLFPTPTDILADAPTPTLPPTATSGAPTVTGTLPPTATSTVAPPTATATQPPGNAYIPNLGINFISSGQHPADDERIQTGIRAGATWDRFAIYWNDIEQTAGVYEWGVYDRTVNKDVKHGLKTNGILIGTSPLYNDGRGLPAHVEQPVFSDGTDTPGSNKTINPANPWAGFVFATVNRYKPGGSLSAERGWSGGKGIRLWEVWNEPDFRQFWPGNVSEYARLLKVSYLAARHADPAAEIMVGGLVLFEQSYFFPELLNIYKNDPSPVAAIYPFDKVAVHSYSYPPNTFYVIETIDSLLTVYGLSHIGIWLNESGVTVWNDYPGPEWATRDDQIVWRATLEEQADYIVQSAVYATMAEAEAIYHFQLYDDCGNQPAGTTFAPHNGGLCESGAVCWGDALGLVRNQSDNLCFNQHPQAGSDRPAYEAFQLIDEIFTSQGIVPLTGFSTGPGENHYKALFARPATSELITFLWNQTGNQIEATVGSRADSATMIQRDGVRSEIARGEDGNYRVLLNPATNRNQIGVSFMIGGPPVILIEQTDTPVVSILPLLDDSPAAFLVRWRSSSQAIQTYEVWYRDEGGSDGWVRWFETTTPGDALFVGGAGRRYSFFARGQLPDGSWTGDAPYVQSWTRVK